MYKIRAFIHFQRRIAIPGLVVSLIIGAFGGTEFLARNIAQAYLFMAPLVHYFVYEVMNANTYLFYANLGFSRWFLWRSTIVISFLVLILSCFL